MNAVEAVAKANYLANVVPVDDDFDRDYWREASEETRQMHRINAARSIAAYDAHLRGQGKVIVDESMIRVVLYEDIRNWPEEVMDGLEAALAPPVEG